ncbi:MAG: nucleotide exchange factor GrpE, partial [bacterium]
ATLAPILQVYDHFLMAQAHAAQASDPATIAEGMRLIADEFSKAFSTLGIERIEAAGRPFDPACHEAVSAENSDTVPAGQVLRQFKPGYRLRDQLLRPAVVVVSNGPAVPTFTAPQDGPTDTAP